MKPGRLSTRPAAKDQGWTPSTCRSSCCRGSLARVISRVGVRQSEASSKCKLDPPYAPRVIYTGSGVGPFHDTKMPSRNFLKSFLVMLHDWRICDAVSDTAPTSLPVSSIWSFTSAVRV